MRIICDATGQTYNRLWAYVTSVARCVAEKTIILYDWTIEDFPNLLHAPLSITRYGNRGSCICLRNGDGINT
jgi:hypothetical protein